MGEMWTVMAMKKKRVKAIIQLRRATEAQWIQRDPVLRLGEPALSTDKNKLKYGDGQSHWSELSYTEDYTAGNGLVLDNYSFSLDDLILDCGTSTTNVGGGE